MKLYYKVLITILLLSSSLYSFSQNKVQEKTPQEYAAEIADKLGEELKLESWAIFYVDSTLQHDYEALKKALENMKKAGIDNQDLYQKTQDKWMERIDSTFQTFFTKSQWKTYLKSQAGKNRKERKKRMAKEQNNKKK